MSKPIIKGEINENTPTIGVNVPDGNVPILPVETIGGGEPTIVSLAVTENGEYTAPSGIDGYSPILVDVDPHLTNLVATENGTYRPESPFEGYGAVVVNVPPVLPNEILISDWDILNASTTYACWNTVTNTALATNNFGGFNLGYITGRGAKAMLDLFTPGSIKRVVVKTGEFDRTQETTDNAQQLFRLITESSHFTMRWLNDTQRWQISDQSGSQVYVDGTILPKYSFDNTTFEIIYGARYINGELYRGIKENNVITADYTSKFAVYVNGVEVATNESVVADGSSHIARIQLAVQNAWVGAKFENVKVYTVTNCYNKYYEEV